ncbi:hypothetical protein AJ79_08959 [Helicocarpus griseus UAMH5409]|uniref:Uncharacterized protein n=1 Tax=Helicocarpus griseus UAMH5409 TaxID=1447875 RepID=A0A2B7WNR7_9EURO|nr:hypothetical protein AJ79_08959 [Helicocarpus griseus UAMH5409]
MKLFWWAIPITLCVAEPLPTALQHAGVQSQRPNAISQEILPFGRQVQGQGPVAIEGDKAKDGKKGTAVHMRRNNPNSGNGSTNPKSMKTKHEQSKTTKSNQKKKKLANKQQKKKTDKNRGKKKRARAGLCWSLLTAIEADDFKKKDLEGITQDELDGMLSLWPNKEIDTPTGNGDIPDHLIKVEQIGHIVIGGATETAGWGGIFSSIAKVVGDIFKKGGKKGGGKKGGKGGGGSNARNIIKDLKTGNRPKASSKVIEAAKKSSRVKKMMKQKQYKDCLRSGPKTNGGKTKIKSYNAELEIDWSRKKGEKLKSMPKNTEGKTISLYTGDKSDTSHKYSPKRTYHDEYIRDDRLLYETCQNPEKAHNNTISDVEVKGGCCAFYSKDKCQAKTRLFSMINRRDKKLEWKDNDSISSWWCTFDERCKGAPGKY